MASGNIADEIDSLEEAKTVAELVKKLIPILHKITYASGDTIGDQETWAKTTREEFMTELAVMHGTATNRQRAEYDSLLLDQD
jgi:5,10-methylenetetrahydrofolate reductase